MISTYIFSLATLLTTANAFSVNINTEIICKRTNALCVSGSAFVFCSNDADFVRLTKRLIYCPVGYVCDDNTSSPCVLQNSAASSTSSPSDGSFNSSSLSPFSSSSQSSSSSPISPSSPISSSSSSSSSSSYPTTTTTSTTQSPPATSPSSSSRKPVHPMKCSSVGFFPGPNCSQYYECVQFWFWLEAELKHCPVGLYFSQQAVACVEPERSNCVNP